MLLSQTPAWNALVRHVDKIRRLHLKDMLADQQRNDCLTAEFDDIVFDFSHQQMDRQTLALLFELAEQEKLTEKIQAMAQGELINQTEKRAVLHIALRAASNDYYPVDGVNVVDAVHSVLNKIEAFTEKVRRGQWLGQTGLPLTDVVSIGIGGSYLGAEFVFEALKTDPAAAAQAKGRRLRFLANVDPVGVSRAIADLNPATTLVIVISKTFTTAETMLNARTMRKWLSDAMGAAAIPKHMIAVSANVEGVTAFGIDAQNIFEFWDWVGGRYSVTSAVGVVPLAMQYGFKIVAEFLEGARDMDQHFLKAPNQINLPILMGLVGVWNSSFLKYPVRALLPYSEALCRLPAHIQQVDMESNGKRVTSDGQIVNYPVGEIDFGEPGTNGQHSFYQLLHQGQVVPADFIGFINSQTPISLPGDPVSNHDELMAAFFSQPDALAYGKQEEDLKKENVPLELIPHKYFSGNRPSSSLLFPSLNARSVGQILALFEHRTAVQGMIWRINSFDQWGVELGKALGKKVRDQLQSSRTQKAPIASSFNSSTKQLLERYLAGSK